MQFIDTHVHINFEVFKDELDSLSSRWRQTGVTKLVHSCVHPEEFESIKNLTNQFPELYCSVGLHPLDAQKWQGEDTYQKILELAQSTPKVVAIGEMGLDFYKGDSEQIQKEVFWKQLEIAQSLKKPVIIHCRDAAESLRTILSQFNQQKGEIKGVMHCWGGTPEETQWFLDLGFYISFSGIVTFKNAKQLQESAKMVPSDRLLIETDCPFLAPVPKRGKRNEPSYVFYVAEKLAQLRNVTLETLSFQTTSNAEKLFGLASAIN
jgi:TatD DNase family protein